MSDTSPLIHPRQLVTFTPVLPPGPAVVALFAEVGPVMKAGGGGGWEVIDRPKRKSMTDWQGYGPYVMELSIVFDKFRGPGSVEADIERLRRMMRAPSKATGTPPVLKVSGPAIPLRQLRWVIQEIETKDEIRNSGGQRVRSFQDVTLLEYVAPDVMKAVPSPAKAVQEKKPPASTPSKTYTVKKGDTLWGIAVRFLGSGPRWTEIQKLNGGPRDPRKLQIGTVLRIP